MSDPAATALASLAESVKEYLATIWEPDSHALARLRSALSDALAALDATL